eukprot:TRINITY_DN39033_c0_g1_i1.p1 TRINITY_DN39033_c0_g1~~TRINITY_DN39033_c0_g1_i1.p1  ORF type:complete len:319 (+),score=85.06 TRINITY_DN39033_c0_g1_i1:122-1078(+)
MFWCGVTACAETCSRDCQRDCHRASDFLGENDEFLPDYAIQDVASARKPQPLSLSARGCGYSVGPIGPCGRGNRRPEPMCNEGAWELSTTISMLPKSPVAADAELVASTKRKPYSKHHKEKDAEKRNSSGASPQRQRILGTPTPLRSGTVRPHVENPGAHAVEQARRHTEQLARIKERCRQQREAYRPAMLEIPEEVEEEDLADADYYRFYDEQEAELLRVRLDDERRVSDFLTAGGFQGVNEKLTKMFRTYLPLHTAIEQNDRELVRCLMALGADPTIRVGGLTAFDVANRLAEKDRSGCFDRTIIGFLGDADVEGL